MLPVPIVLTAFGTTTRARETYDFMDGLIRAAFPGRDLHWAFSSRTVRDRLQDKKKSAARHPHEVLRALADQGHEWAVVQSVHLLCGHEFFRLIDEVQTQPIRTSIGLPLFSSREDYLRLAGALGLPKISPPASPGPGGSRHRSPRLGRLPCPRRRPAPGFRGRRIFVGVVEASPSRDEVVRAVTAAGRESPPHPPMLVGRDPLPVEDLCDGPDSWPAAFTGASLEVAVAQGIEQRAPAVVDVHRPHPGGPGHHPGSRPGGHGLVDHDPPGRRRNPRCTWGGKAQRRAWPRVYKNHPGSTDFPALCRRSPSGMGIDRSPLQEGTCSHESPGHHRHPQRHSKPALTLGLLAALRRRGLAVQPSRLDRLH